MPLASSTKKNEELFEKKAQNSTKTRNKKTNAALIGAISSSSHIGLNGNNLVNTIINIYQTNLLSPKKKNYEYDKLMKTFQKFKRPNFNGNNNSNNSKSNYNSNNNNNANNQNILNKKDSQKNKKHGRCNSIYSSNNNYDNHYNLEVNIKNNLRTQSKKVINTKNLNDNLNSLNINFNNFTNNFNYNYNINPMNNINNNNVNNINNGNINYNNNNNIFNSSIINKVKSNSQKVIMGKVTNKNENTFKGIPINGFDKLIMKKYNTRNLNIPMSVTDRIKQTNNIYSTSIANNNTYSNRYKNSHSKYINNNREHKK